jgi:integrase
MSLIMRQMLNYAVEKELISKSPFTRVKVEARCFVHYQKKAASSEVFLIDEQPLVVAEALKDSELTGSALPLAIPLAFQTGLRIGEILGLKFSDVEGDYLHVQRMEVEDRIQLDNGKWKCNGYKIVEHTKTKAGNRRVILTEAAKELIEKAKALNEANGFFDDDYIFINERGRVHFKAIDSRVKKYCRKAGISEKSIHKIRKTYISTLIDANLNIDQIRRLVGHESEQTTYQCYCYNRLTDTQTMDLVNKALA